LRGDPKISLSHFLTAYKLRPSDIEFVKKVIQAYYRVEDYRNAAVYREKFLSLVANSGDPEVRGIKEFCFDQFDATGGRFFVYETVHKTGDLYNWFTFKLVGIDGKVIKTINLETSTVINELGLRYILGQNNGATHSTFNVGFNELPAYSDLKQVVLKVNAGELLPVTSIRPSSK
jgi:hypothetical protein